jgi:hypothetical protein
MSPKKGTSSILATPHQIAELKRLAAGIIRVQGNRFIKELLRNKEIRLGTNKDDFERNLNEAIESGQLVLADVEEWLTTIEGWGDQHVYLYKISPTLQSELTKTNIRERVKQAGFDHVWNQSTALTFPQEPVLTSISFNNSVFRVIWQETSPAWTPTPEKNYEKDEGLDTFEYRAYRRVEQRIITRFEAHLDKGLAGLFIPKPIQGSEHQTAINEAMRVLEQLLDLQTLQEGQLDVSIISKNLDQANATGNQQLKPAITTQKSRLSSGGSYVEFAAEDNDKGYGDEPAIQNVRLSVRSQQLKSFQGTESVFIFQPESTPGSLTRPLRVQLYGRGKKRIRLWAQMNSGEVWTILTKLSKYA